VNITYLELAARDLAAQQDFYVRVLELPVEYSAKKLQVRAGTTNLVFTQAAADFDGAYHFAFNIPENHFRAAKAWILNRVPLLHDESGKDEFESGTWDSQSVYFKDAAGNVLEFIARRRLKNAVVKGDFGGSQILNVSEIGLPSEDVIGLARELCTRLNISVFQQEPNEMFTPVGDDHGLFILPIKNRIWIPNSGVPARLLPLRVKVEVNGREHEIRGVPYEIL
jgi:catechol-2,3-dioxygenase